MSKVTTDFAIEYLLDDCDDCPEKTDDNECISQSHCFEVKRMAIQALEQMNSLDKIRAEIEQNAYPIVHGVNNHELGMTLYGILQVIDKYRKESED